MKEILKDQYGRMIDYVRLSITNQCNLNCTYCKPASYGKNKAVNSANRDLIQKHQELIVKNHCEDQTMTKDEILKLAHCFTMLGVTKFKITGGEPLLRSDCIDIIKSIHAMPGVTSVTITTNGTLLYPKISDLIDAGVNAVNISLDTMDRCQYEQITGIDNLAKVLDAIHACIKHGITTKINCVVLPGINDQHLMELVQLAKEEPVSVRFIERMPIGIHSGIHNKRTMIDLTEPFVQSGWKLITDVSKTGPAVYYENVSYHGTIGFITPMTNPFCSSCNRVRIQSDGVLRLCLGNPIGIDLLPMLRQTENEEIICQNLREMIYQKPAKHQFKDQTLTMAGSSMQTIGG